MGQTSTTFDSEGDEKIWRDTILKNTSKTNVTWHQICQTVKVRQE